VDYGVPVGVRFPRGELAVGEVGQRGFEADLPLRPSSPWQAAQARVYSSASFAGWAKANAGNNTRGRTALKRGSVSK